jgi:hypothetical protein
MALPDTTTNPVDAQADTGIREATTTTTTGEPTMIINAFHPDYMKTYHPDFMTDFRTVEANQVARDAAKPRKLVKRAKVSVKVPKQTHVRSKTNQNMTMAEVKAEMLKVTTFHVYSKAGVWK